jgi:hypothetical protein
MEKGVLSLPHFVPPKAKWGREEAFKGRFLIFQGIFRWPSRSTSQIVLVLATPHPGPAPRGGASSARGYWGFLPALCAGRNPQNSFSPPSRFGKATERSGGMGKAANSEDIRLGSISFDGDLLQKRFFGLKTYL